MSMKLFKSKSFQLKFQSFANHWSLRYHRFQSHRKSGQKKDILINGCIE